MLNDWNSGKLRYYTEVPSSVAAIAADKDNALLPAEQAAALVASFAAEFDVDSLDADIRALVDGRSGASSLFFVCFLWPVARTGAIHNKHPWGSFKINIMHRHMTDFVCITPKTCMVQSSQAYQAINNR